MGYKFNQISIKMTEFLKQDNYEISYIQNKQARIATKNLKKKDIEWY